MQAKTFSRGLPGGGPVEAGWKNTSEYRVSQLLALIGVVVLSTSWVTEQTLLQVQTGKATTAFSTLLSHSNSEVQELSEVLASDYGLRESILANDPLTIDSTLRNHQKRVSAQRMLAISGNSQIIGDTGNRIPRGTSLAQSSLAPVSAQRITSLHVTEGKLFRYATAAIHAPGPVGQLLVGYDMERRLTQDAGELVNLKVAFVCAVDQSNMRINRGSFSQAMMPEIEKIARKPSTALSRAPTAGDERIITALNLDVSTGDRCQAILGESTHTSNNALLIVEMFGWLTLITGLTLFGISAIRARLRRKQQQA
jgi:hypothetical protein